MKWNKDPKCHSELIQNVKQMTKKISLFCFANAQTSQALYALKGNFKELLAIKLNLEEYRCPSQRWQRSAREMF
jgi:hypothetical protein